MSFSDNANSPISIKRSHSAAPRMETQTNDNNTSWTLDDHRDLHYIRISSWKFLKKRHGGVYVIYPIHVFMKSGLHWTVDRRFSEFYSLHKELCRAFQKPNTLDFPKKRWFFNFSEDCLAERKEKFEAYLTEILTMRPIPLELNYFLDVTQNIRSNLEAQENGLKRSSSMGSLSAALSIHDFDLIKVLGQGSFGKVYLVRPHGAPVEEVYAMKALKKSEVEKRKQVDHTMSERKIMAAIHCPFILRLRFAFQTSHKLFMVTDYCSGGELFFHLKKMRRFSESMMRFYTVELAVALDHLHSHHIIYRDMKPENVLLDRFGHVKLTDFGLSKILLDGTTAVQATTFCGTPEYLAPELILHRRHNSGYTYDVDWWSLGIVAYELLTGWPPFFDKDFDQMCEKILRKPIRFPGKYSISMDAQQLIRGFLERNPAERLGGVRAGGLRTLQDHIFFNDTDWDVVMRGQCRPPFIPLSGPDPSDTRNFDTEFTKLSVKDGPGNREETATPSLLDYEGFSFLDDEYKQLLSELHQHETNSSSQFYDLTQATEEIDDDRPSMD